MQQWSHFLLQAQWFADEHREEHSRDWHHVTQPRKQHGGNDRSLLHTCDKYALLPHMAGIMFSAAIINTCHFLNEKGSSASKISQAFK